MLICNAYLKNLYLLAVFVKVYLIDTDVSIEL